VVLADVDGVEAVADEPVVVLVVAEAELAEEDVVFDADFDDDAT
jgi:hypothetical protein